jgi:hypothetical protein
MLRVVSQIGTDVSEEPVAFTIMVWCPTDKLLASKKTVILILFAVRNSNLLRQGSATF